MLSIVSAQKFWSYPGRGLEETHMACADIRKLWKLFDDKETAIGELWHLVPVLKINFQVYFKNTPIIHVNKSVSAAYRVT